MRTVSNETTTVKATPVTGLETYSETLSDGRTLTIREMTGRDLIYLEEEIGEFKQTKQSFLLAERLTIGEDKISFDEIADLRLSDIKKISELVGKAMGEVVVDPKS
jgi:hypothetical protein